MNWGTKIIIAFVCFIGLIFGLVYTSINHDISLVADNYYEQELAYEDQIQRIKNSNDLKEKLDFKIDRQALMATFTFPGAIKEQFKEGTIHFFRPSNAKMDMEYPMLMGKEGVQEVNLKELSNGFWKIKINWKSDKKEFYQEISLVL